MQDDHEKKALLVPHSPKIPADTRFLTAEDVHVTRVATSVSILHCHSCRWSWLKTDMLPKPK